MRNKLGFVLSAMQAVSSILLLGASTLLISTAATHVPIMMLMTLVVMVRAFAIGRAAFRYGERLLLHDAAFRMLSRIRVRVFEKLEPIAPVGLKAYQRGDLVSRMVEDVDELQSLQLRVLPGLIQSVVATIVAIGLVAWILPSLAILTLAVMLSSFALALGVSFLFGSQSQAMVSSQRADLYAKLIDSSERSDVILAYGWNSTTESSIANKSNELVKLEKRSARAAGLAGAVLVIGLALAQFLAANLGSIAVLNGTVDRVFLASFILVPAAVFEFYQLSLPAVPALRRYIGSKRRVDEILQIKSVERGGNSILRDFESLSCSGATIEYETGSTIRFPDFELAAGSSVALLGKSGSGKSSFANILVGFLSPLGGQVLINEEPIQDYSLDSLRSIVGLVEQTSSMLVGSVEANLRIAKPSALDSELIEILHKVGLWKMLEGREGLETQVGENGKNLSGGEISRLGLARVLLAQRQLVILDEPTAALDRELGKELVFELLAVAKREQKTVILITHDLGVADYCDAVVTFGESAL